MARLVNAYGVSKTLSAAMPKLANLQKTRMRLKGLLVASRKAEELEEQSSLQGSRRVATVGLAAASVAVFVSSGNGVAWAEDNGYWVTGPIPVPPVFNSEFSKPKPHIPHCMFSVVSRWQLDSL